MDDLTLPPDHQGHIGRYALVGVVERDETGIVYRAIDPRLGREIAIKHLPDRSARNAESRSRFEREARRLASLNHPNIATLYTLEESEGSPFITMELVRGRALADQIRKDGLSVQEALAIGRQVASALEAAHARGIAHGSLSPGNVFINESRVVKLVDFGISSLTDSSALSTKDGEELDLTPDVNAFGRVLAACATGRVDAADADGAPAALPESVRALLKRCLSGDGAVRIGRMAEARKVLDEAAIRVAMPTSQTRRGRRGGGRLPVPLTRFIGRDRELLQVCEAVREQRLLTLTGGGGHGKTRLALEVGVEVGDDFADGVWMTELAAMRENSLVAQQVAATLGVKEAPRRELADVIVDYLRVKDALLIVDNCEHLVDEVAQLLSKLITYCPGLKVLATSRQPLGIDGEQVFPVAPLQEADAISLFVSRVRELRQEFQLTDANRETVEQICRRLDGIPLALELAASRSRALSVTDLAGRLDDRFRLLAGRKAGLEHHRTLRAMIDWSHELLEPEEQQLFRRLAVFAGGWTLEAADAVVGEVDVLDDLSGLVEKSLVVVDPGGPSGRTRFRMLETIHAYASDRLTESDDADAVGERHREYFRGYAMARTGDETQDTPWQMDLGTEHANLSAAFAASLDANEVTEAAKMADALVRYRRMRGLFSEGRATVESVLVRSSEIDDGIRARLLHLAAAFCCDQGDLDAATRNATASLELAEAVGSLPDQATAAGYRGLASLYQSRMEDAERYIKQSLELARKIGDARTEAASVYHLGDIAVRQGDLARAHEHYAEALETRRRIGDVRGEAAALTSLGVTAMYGGDFDTADLRFEEARALMRAIEDRRGLASTLNNSGAVAINRAETERAHELFSQALEIARDLGDRRMIGQTLHNLGETQIRLGSPDDAVRSLEEALEIAVAMGDGFGEGMTLHSLGSIALERGAPAQSRDYFQRGLDRARELSDRRAIPACLQGLALVALHEHDWTGAIEQCREGLTYGVPPTETAQTLEVVAQALAGLDEPEVATTLLAAADEVWKKTGAVRDPLRVQGLESTVEGLRQRLDADFDRVWFDGRQLTLEQATDIARR